MLRKSSDDENGESPVPHFAHATGRLYVYIMILTTKKYKKKFVPCTTSFFWMPVTCPKQVFSLNAGTNCCIGCDACCIAWWERGVQDTQLWIDFFFGHYFQNLCGQFFSDTVPLQCVDDSPPTETFFLAVLMICFTAPVTSSQKISFSAWWWFHSSAFPCFLG